jgi:hypothetical protein
MWDDSKRQRFKELRELPEPRGTAQQAELDMLIQELERDEASYLGPATQRLRQERGVLESRNRALEELARRRKELATRLEKALVEARSENRAIEEELASLLTAGPTTSGST